MERKRVVDSLCRIGQKDRMSSTNSHKKNIRLIARLDIKGTNLVKGIQLEGLRKLGDPNAFARKYYEQGIDEIVYMDIVASLYNRNSILPLIKNATQDIFVPLTVGGGIRSIDDVEAALKAGADKVAINTAAIKNPDLIKEVANRFGAQCMVLSIEAKKQGDHWEAYTDNGREKSAKNVVEWVQEAQELGAGEIMLTSVDCEGLARGMDIPLIQAVQNVLTVPLIVSGGIGAIEHIDEVTSKTDADAIAMAHILHYDKVPLSDIHAHYKDSETVDMRQDPDKAFVAAQAAKAEERLAS